MPAKKRVTRKPTTSNRPARKATTRKAAAPRRQRETEVPVITPPTTKRIVGARGDGIDKANTFAEFAEGHGWWFDVEENEDDNNVVLTIKRDDGRYKETFVITWIGQRIRKGGITYNYVGGPTFNLHNLMAVQRHVEGSRAINRNRTVRTSNKEERLARRARIRGVSIEEVRENPRGEGMMARPLKTAEEHAASTVYIQARGEDLTPVNSGPFDKESGSLASLKAYLEGDGYDVTLVPMEEYQPGKTYKAPAKKRAVRRPAIKKPATTKKPATKRKVRN